MTDRATAQEWMQKTPIDTRALIAIDLGAESCRVSLLQWKADEPEMRLVHRFRNGAVRVDGDLRWPLGSILKELDRGLRQCAELAPEGIRSIAVDGWAVDYVRLDEAGYAIADPFCYRDERTLEAEKELHERLTADRMRQITGIQIMRINTVYQMCADAPVLKKMRWLHLPEYVLWRLGGRAIAERTNATHSQMVGLDGEWSAEIFEALGQSIEDAPEIVSPGTDLGQLKGELARLPAFRDTRLIAPACHDTASAIAGIADPGDDWAYISSGTWSLVGAVIDTPVNTPEAAAANFTNLGAADGRTLFHKNVNGLWLLRQCMEVWCASGVDLTISDVVVDAEVFGPRGYVLDVDDPELLLEGNMPERINRQLRRRRLPELRASAEHAPEMASFLFYSLAARYADVLKSVKTLTGRKFSNLYIVGGGSRNTSLNRLAEQATGLQVKAADAESSTLGNFAVQLTLLESEGESERKITHETRCRWAARLSAGTRIC